MAKHFDLPFRFVPGGGVAVVDQDTPEDVANCVECIVRTPLGFRNDAPDFGFPLLEFTNIPIVTGDILPLIDQQEPRIETVLSESPSIFDPVLSTVIADIGKQQL